MIFISLGILFLKKLVFVEFQLTEIRMPGTQGIAGHVATSGQ